MAVVPHTIDIVVSDMKRSLAFYASLGLDVPADKADDVQVQIETAGHATIGLVSEAVVRQQDPDWRSPVGQRVTFSCRCDSPAEVDQVYERVEAAGFPGMKQPWDAFWGQRYAFLRDPDGNRVDLFAEL